MGRESMFIAASVEPHKAISPTKAKCEEKLQKSKLVLNVTQIFDFLETDGYGTYGGKTSIQEFTAKTKKCMKRVKLTPSIRI